MSNSNKVSTAELLYLQVNPKKLSDKKVSQVYDRLNKLGKIIARHSTYTNTVDKVWFIHRTYKFVDIYIEKGKLREFINTFKLDLTDFKNVRGGNEADIRTLSEKTQAEINESDLSFKLPARRIKHEPGDSLEKSILETVDEIEKEEASMSEEQLEESLLRDREDDNLIDVSNLADMSAIEGDATPFNSQVSFEVSRSMLSSGNDDKDVPGKNNSKGKSGQQRVEILGVDTGKDTTKAKTDIKLDATASIPVWRKSLDADENSRFVESYIRDLERLKTLNIGKEDAWLINASLVKSNRTELYVELPAGADTDIAKFVTYLRAAYGLSKVAKRRALNNIKQASSESAHAFLSRIINTYYEVRGEEKKTLTEIEADKNEKYDIVSLFLKGLQNSKVRIALKQKIGELTMGNLSTNTRDITEALQDENVQNTAVNLVMDGHKTINSKVDDLAQKIEAITINMAKFSAKQSDKHFRQNKRFEPYTKNKANKQPSKAGQDSKISGPPKGVKFRGECFYCGKSGHSKRYCKKRLYDMAHPSK